LVAGLGRIDAFAGWPYIAAMNRSFMTMPAVKRRRRTATARMRAYA
jgi:hypothetical protein